MQIDLLAEGDEIRLVVGDEDGLLSNDDLVKDRIARAQKIAIAIAGRPIPAAVGPLDERGGEALVDPEFHAAAVERRDW